MKTVKPSLFLAVIGWGSVFILGWLLLLGIIHLGGLSICFLVFYFLVALIASGVASGDKAKPKNSNYEINVDGHIYDQQDFIVQQMSDGKIYIYLKNSFEEEPKARTPKDCEKK